MSNIQRTVPAMMEMRSIMPACAVSVDRLSASMLPISRDDTEAVDSSLLSTSTDDTDAVDSSKSSSGIAKGARLYIKIK